MNGRAGLGPPRGAGGGITWVGSGVWTERDDASDRRTGAAGFALDAPRRGGCSVTGIQRRTAPRGRGHAVWGGPVAEVCTRCPGSGTRVGAAPARAGTFPPAAAHHLPCRPRRASPSTRHTPLRPDPRQRVEGSFWNRKPAVRPNNRDWNNFATPFLPATRAGAVAEGGSRSRGTTGGSIPCAPFPAEPQPPALQPAGDTPPVVPPTWSADDGCASTAVASRAPAAPFVPVVTTPTTGEPAAHDSVEPPELGGGVPVGSAHHSDLGRPPSPAFWTAAGPAPETGVGFFNVPAASSAGGASGLEPERGVPWSRALGRAVGAALPEGTSRVLTLERRRHSWASAAGSETDSLMDDSPEESSRYGDSTSHTTLSRVEGGYRRRETPTLAAGRAPDRARRHSSSSTAFTAPSPATAHYHCMLAYRVHGAGRSTPGSVSTAGDSMMLSETLTEVEFDEADVADVARLAQEGARELELITMCDGRRFVRAGTPHSPVDADCADAASALSEVEASGSGEGVSEGGSQVSYGRTRSYSAGSA